MVTVRGLGRMWHTNKVRLHHTAWARGYISRKTDGYVEEYKGRYGEGYVWNKPSYKSTNYYLKAYFIKK